jgi:hypothetical protein
VLALAAVLLGATASFAQAELSASGNLFVTFNGGIFPAALPRRALSSISVRLGGKVRTLSGEHPPALRGIYIALNRAGHLDVRGLSTCRRRQVESTSSAQALAACADALVGTGNYVAKTSFPEQASFASHGKILAFNSTSAGHPAILIHVYGQSPAPTTRTFVFQIHHTSGTFGTILTAALPQSLNRFGYLKRINLILHRTYSYRGATHSYLSANCPAPAGLREASFKFADTSMTFADGRTLAATLTRTCMVK